MATLTVGDLTPRDQYTATNLQTAFTYSFPIFSDSDLKVYVGATLKTLSTHYTVSNAGTSSGGNVTFVSGLATGDIVTIYRDLPVARTTDYATGGSLLAENLNDDLDKLIMMVQQQESEFVRTIKLQKDDEDATMALPLKATRSNKLMGFDSNGDVAVTSSSMTEIDATVGAAMGSGVLASAYQFTGDGTTVAFTLAGSITNIPNEQSVIVDVDGITQHTDTYTTATNVVTFSVAPPTNSDIQVRFNAYLSSTAVVDASAVDYDQGGTGSVSRTVATKLQETISVKDFGATGDGITDDSTTIQAAIDSLTSGGRLYFPVGVYLLGGQLNFGVSGLTFFGEGSESILKLKSTSTTEKILNTAGGVSNVDNTTIERLKFVSEVVSSSGTQSMINFDNHSFDGIAVQDCIFSNPTSYSNCIFVKANTGKTAKKIRILNNIVESSHRMGFEIINHDNGSSYNATDVIVSGNTFLECDLMSISISGPVSRVSINNNIISNNTTTTGFAGVELVGPRACNVSNNIFSGTFTHVISSSGGTYTVGKNISITGNTTEGEITGKVFLSNAGSLVFSDNQFSLSAYVEFTGASTDGCLVHNNRIVTSAAYAIICDNSPNHIIKNNYLDNSASTSNFATVRAYQAGSSSIVLVGNTINSGTGGEYYDENSGGTFLLTEQNILASKKEDNILPSRITRFSGVVTPGGTTSTATINLNPSTSWRPYSIKVTAVCCSTSGSNAGAAERHLNVKTVNSASSAQITSDDIVTSAGLTLANSFGTGTAILTATVASGTSITWSIELTAYYANQQTSIPTVDFA